VTEMDGTVGFGEMPATHAEPKVWLVVLVGML